MKTTVALLAVASALAGCGSSSPSEKPASPSPSATASAAATEDVAETPPPAKTATSKSDDDYPAQVRKNFLENCEVDWTEEGCTCSLERIEAMMTIREFIDVEDDYKKSGELPDSLKEAALACA